ncbi:acyl-CoA dehydrogenase [Corynebacterium sp. 320]|uniref:Acyl-CoA dehydrogenase n=1 Tax=Corynebacterium zhongnanshanii TaxID=2768834 RepID=A0ABQ6VC94_9CORY|nr:MULTISPECIES: acyl-CoA dehydrogenase family protein [Corynebacterium]KAB1503053.1 acyl-CoA dehydrogenase [Corynebacterium sp. 320]KAB1550736.1 acyl-CoA dehydrogenase [Corynebacterium sp. 321]KAB1551095.1 acyl-CoA dehydrogenase [Corynebacterium sp. 319]KAB3519847.1 acyl-CoA dehydrogenase [Corynebacterium zhongnanshanii]KAB3526850.1 acyl-CoA dehydrogenase [Corynebacterium sp. 250]
MSDRSKRDDSTPGLNNIKRDAIGNVMRVLTRFTGSELAEKYGLGPKIDRVAYESTKTGMRTLGAVNRQFKKIKGTGKPVRLPSQTLDENNEPVPSTEPKPGRAPFDLNPTEDQEMIVAAVREFAEERLRPVASECNEKAEPAEGLLDTAAELGVALINLPEEYEGIANASGATTNALIAEALAFGDMGLAVSILAPAAVANVITNYGDDSQQKTYLPEFAGETFPPAAVVVSEARPLFDPFVLQTTAVREGNDIVINGVKTMVPNAGKAELFVVAIDLDGVNTFAIVESGTEGVVVEADPSMGLRGAALGRLLLKDVRVPAANLLGGTDLSDDERNENYAEIIRRSRLGWAALAAGTGEAVLEYTKKYVNEREAFGEPISHRQAVAFMVANLRIELDGLRLILQRGASRLDQGLSYHREAALARRFASDKGMVFGLDGVQLLGGHGFTKEHPVERWYRDLRAIGIAEGVVVL